MQNHPALQQFRQEMENPTKAAAVQRHLKELLLANGIKPTDSPAEKDLYAAWKDLHAEPKPPPAEEAPTMAELLRATMKAKGFPPMPPLAPKK